MHFLVGVQYCKAATLVRSGILRYSLANNFISRGVADLVVNHNVTLDPACKAALDSGTIKHRKHAGRLEVGCVDLPDKLQHAASVVLEKYSVDDMLMQSERMYQYLWSRHAPIERDKLQSQADTLEKQLIEKENVDLSSLNEDEREKFRLKIRNKLTVTLRHNTYKWEPIRFDAYRSILYLVSRLAFDYSTTYKILREIKKRDAEFSPCSVFHFGSGIGSSIWASNTLWSRTTTEHHCVDISEEMNTLARLLLQEGKENGAMLIPGVYFRRFLPSDQTSDSELVISSYSLMELAGREERLKVISNLWNRTTQYLVIVENGTKAGYNLVMEARDFILKNQSGCSDENKSEVLPLTQNSSHHGNNNNNNISIDNNSGNNNNNNTISDTAVMSAGHVFSPCAHDLDCPRLARDDGTPCNFEVTYSKLQQSGLHESRQTARYSYVVLKKGKINSEEVRWPRVVRPVTCASGCAHIRTCTPSGQLQYSAITTAKHTKDLYWCARACTWGDLLPVIYPTQQQIDSNEEAKQAKRKSRKVKQTLASDQSSENSKETYNTESVTEDQHVYT